MNDDELKKLWQRQPLREPDLSPVQLMSAMQNKTTLLRRCLNARDLRELIACGLVIIVFGFFYFTVYRTPIARAGDLIVIGSSIFIAWRLIHARRRTPPAPPGATIVESLRAELNSVRTQSRMLGSILWWYLLPLAAGVLICTWGSSRHVAYNIAYTIFVIALFAFIYRLNQRARAKQLLPVEAQLESLIHSAETGEPVDESHLAALRPVVLSMSAVENAKPTEFKVAFWQIALWGEVGFIGIWFFLMLGLGLDKVDWAVKSQAPQTATQSLPAGESSRYSAAAQKIVDLLNAGDVAAVQEMFNPAMSKVLPARKTADVLTGLASRFGKIENFDGPIGKGYGGWTVFRLHCQRGEVTMTLALDANDKISGLYFQPAAAPGMKLKSLVPWIFTWQHLLWLVLFFLAGLIYSWLLQKLTERAVGISPLGIHLYKGLNLVLWNEIKEVRPLRVLNIRSLWLIKESGEKLIMPWTSLERTSELKSSVETNAPENHPIRKYLPLLKQK
jgi:hypothetical protein